MSNQKVRDYFKNLYLVAAADFKLAAEETSFLVQVAQQMGLGPLEASEIMRQPSSPLTVPVSESEKMAQLEDIVVMMMVDRKIHEKEYQLCLRFAEAIGKDKATLDYLIIKIIRGK
ncbi:MAG: hypothetical protein HC913_22075 [Microscillaceae bacterium]|nr:hypothetical protein [Microscillaceae bacterium]